MLKSNPISCFSLDLHVGSLFNLSSEVWYLVCFLFFFYLLKLNEQWKNLVLSFFGISGCCNRVSALNPLDIWCFFLSFNHKRTCNFIFLPSCLLHILNVQKASRSADQQLVVLFNAQISSPLYRTYDVTTSILLLSNVCVPWSSCLLLMTGWLRVSAYWFPHKDKRSTDWHT